MNGFITFIKENLISILFIVITIIGLLVLFSIKEWDLNKPKPDSKLVQEVTVETLESMNTIDIVNNNIFSSPNDNFCETYTKNSAELEKACSRLTDKNCKETKCCVLTNTGKCLAGSIDGPIYKKNKDGNLISMDYYYYLNKCYGNNCP